jgi:hypothetical protein
VDGAVPIDSRQADRAKGGLLTGEPCQVAGLSFDEELGCPDPGQVLERECARSRSDPLGAALHGVDHLAARQLDLLHPPFEIAPESPGAESVAAPRAGVVQQQAMSRTHRGERQSPPQLPDAA